MLQPAPTRQLIRFAAAVRCGYRSRDHLRSFGEQFVLDSDYEQFASQLVTPQLRPHCRPAGGRITLPIGIGLLVRCKACHHQDFADLQAIIGSGRGDVPLIHLRFRCAECGSRRTGVAIIGCSRGARGSPTRSPGRAASATDVNLDLDDHGRDYPQR